MPRKEQAGGDLLFTICVDCCNSGVCLYFTVFFLQYTWVGPLGSTRFFPSGAGCIF